MYVEDHCEAIYLVLKNGRLGETYNIGGGNQPFNIDLVHELCSILDELKPASKPYKDLVAYVPDRLGHDRRYAMDVTKIRNELGWTPRHDIETGLRETVKWYLAHLDWVEAIRKQDHYNDWLEQNYTRRGR
jgi:dTDP-glucose 4,6-dehydratase